MTTFRELFQGNNTRNSKFRKSNGITVNTHVVVNDVKCVGNQRILSTKIVKIREHNENEEKEILRNVLKYKTENEEKVLDTLWFQEVCLQF